MDSDFIQIVSSNHVSVIFLWRNHLFLMHATSRVSSSDIFPTRDDILNFLTSKRDVQSSIKS